MQGLWRLSRFRIWTCLSLLQLARSFDLSVWRYLFSLVRAKAGTPDQDIPAETKLVLTLSLLERPHLVPDFNTIDSRVCGRASL